MAAREKLFGHTIHRNGVRHMDRDGNRQRGPRGHHEDEGGPRRSMTYGVMPSRKEFAEHYDYYVGEGRYRIRNDRLVGDVDLTERELYDLVKRFGQSAKEDKSSLASSIMTTLGFEWI